MKALVVKQPWASLIALGYKNIETRTWKTKYKGGLLICSAKNPNIPGMPCGYVLCYTEILNCVPFEYIFEEHALCPVDEKIKQYAWILSNIKPKMVRWRNKGQLGLFNVDIEEKEILEAEIYLPTSLNVAETMLTSVYYSIKMHRLHNAKALRDMDTT